MVPGGSRREKKRGRSAGSARRRRGASAFILDVRARGQCRVARSNGLEGAGLGEPSAGEVAWPGGRCVAGGLAHGRRWTGEGREQREEREIRGLIQNSNFSQRFFLKHEKL